MADYGVRHPLEEDLVPEEGAGANASSRAPFVAVWPETPRPMPRRSTGRRGGQESLDVDPPHDGAAQRLAVVMVTGASGDHVPPLGRDDLVDDCRCSLVDLVALAAQRCDGTDPDAGRGH